MLRGLSRRMALAAASGIQPTLATAANCSAVQPETDAAVRLRIVAAVNRPKAVVGTEPQASVDKAPSQVGLSLFHAPAWMAPTWSADRAATASAESDSSPGSVAMRAGDSVRIMSGRRPLAPAAARRFT